MSEIVDFLIDWMAAFTGHAWAVFLTYTLLTVAVLLFVLAVAPGYVWLMRKVMARIQNRAGPNRVGPFGLLQPVADGIKLIAKEDVRPRAVDPLTWGLAVPVLLIPVLIVFLFLPWHPGLVIADVGTGLLLVLALSAISPVGEVLAGWGSNNKYSVLGGIRAAAMDVAYEVPLVISAVGVILLSGTMSLEGIVEAQDGLWFLIPQFLGFLIFFVAALAQIGIAPIDLAEAESELVAGFHTEYSGMRFGLLFLTVFANIILMSALTVVLFLGGWQNPVTDPVMLVVFGAGLAIGALAAIRAAVGSLTDGDTMRGMGMLGLGVTAALLLLLMFLLPDGIWWFLLKLFLVSVFVLVTWFTLPRVRIDEFLNVGWKWLFPLSLVNLVIAAVLAKGGFF